MKWLQQNDLRRCSLVLYQADNIFRCFSRYLDLRGMRKSGYYRFHCLASNIINGIRHTKVMATKLRVIGESYGYSCQLSSIDPTCRMSRWVWPTDVELGFFRVIFAFCATNVPQNAKITRKNPSSGYHAEMGVFRQKEVKGLITPQWWKWEGHIYDDKPGRHADHLQPPPLYSLYTTCHILSYCKEENLTKSHIYFIISQ